MVTPVPDAVALFDSVSVRVPAPETTVVPDGKLALVIPTLPPPTRPPAFTMSGGKVPDASVIVVGAAGCVHGRGWPHRSCSVQAGRQPEWRCSAPGWCRSGGGSRRPP